MTGTIADRRAATAATLAIAAMIAELVAGRSARDAMFLSTYGAGRLPYMMIAASLASLGALFVASRAMGRRSPARVVTVALTTSSALLFLQWLATWYFADVVSVSLYVHLAVFGPVVTSGFWSLVNERFDPHTAKQHMGRLGAGATFGGIVGGLVTAPISASLGVTVIVLLLAVFHFLAAVSVVAFARLTSRPSTPVARHAAPESAAEALRRLPYLRHLASFVMVIAFTSALIDYTMRATAASVFVEEASLLHFFAAFYTVTAVLAFAVQSGLGGASLARLGLAGTVAVLPAGILFGSALTVWLPALVRAVVLRGVDVVLQSSLHRSGYELFYTPVAAAWKRAAKPLIDVGADKIGQALGSGLVLALLGLVPAWSGQLVMGFAMMGSAVALLLTFHLHRGYVQSLEASLVDHDHVHHPVNESSGEWSVVAAWETARSFEREELLRGLESATAKPPALDERRDGRAGGLPLAAVPGSDPFLAAATEFRSGDATRVREALARARPLDTRLVPLVIPYLGDEALVGEAVSALREVANLTAGVLVDHLLSHHVPFVVQRRLPRVLQACDSPVAVAGLLAVVRGDRRLALRWHASRALVRMPAATVVQAIGRDAVLERVRHELEVNTGSVPATALSHGARQAKQERDAMCLEHVLNLLALVFDREPLRLAQHAFRDGDRAARGTALEYLDNVLPPVLFDALRDLAGASPSAPRSRRSREQMVAELRRSAAGEADDDA